MQMRHVVAAAVAVAGLLLALPGGAQQLTNPQLTVTVDAQDGSYRFATRAAGNRPVLSARVGAEIDHQWVHSNDYPQHRGAESAFQDEIGSGRQIRVACTGLEGKPDLVYVVQLYNQLPYAGVQVEIQNHAGRPVTVQAIRGVEAIGQPAIGLEGRESADRVLSDSFSEGGVQISDLGHAPLGRGGRGGAAAAAAGTNPATAPAPVHRGVWSQLIYNRESKESLFVGALTADRFATVLRLTYQGSGDNATIASYTVDSTGTTDARGGRGPVPVPASAQAGAQAPGQQRIELSLQLNPGQNLASERLMMQAGTDYHAQLLAYGDAIRRLHHARVSSPNLIGWWSWTSYYMAINEGAVLTNAQWLAENLKPLGYNYLHIDEGYQYARGEYVTANATQFPHGMRYIGDAIRRLGLNFAIWTAPFEVTNRAWVYEHHKDWLVHTADGTPIQIGMSASAGDRLYALDQTHPEAQEYLRQTYTTLTREWGIRYIKLDFMDTAAIEGYHYKPDTTALEAQRIGLAVIRKAVGDDVLLDKDGSPMLPPVGLVDEGRTGGDTAHSFPNTKNVATSIAARFYMHRNWFVNDPDAFNIGAEVPVGGGGGRGGRGPVSLPEAQAAIALSAISGGMYEIGDDLPTLGAEKDRLALVQNQDLLAMAKISRASTPVDLMTFEAADEQPSIFFLREDARQSILTVFNFTEQPRSHALPLASLGLSAGHAFQVSDVLNQGERLNVSQGAVRLENQAPHSVRVIKLIDSTVAAAAPGITAQVPSEAKVSEPIPVSAETEASGVPALAFHWDFGDGITADGPHTSHAYTRAADFTVQLTVDGLDGMAAHQSFPVKVTGTLDRQSDLTQNRRYTEPSGR